MADAPDLDAHGPAGLAPGGWPGQNMVPVAITLPGSRVKAVVRRALRLPGRSLAPVPGAGRDGALAGRDCTVGDFTAADIMLGHACYMASRSVPVGDDMPDLKACIDRIAARPAFDKAIGLN